MNERTEGCEVCKIWLELPTVAVLIQTVVVAAELITTVP